MATTTAFASGTSVRAPNAFTSRKPARPQPRTVVRASKDADEQPTHKAPSDFVMKTVGAFAAAQLAFLPAAGPALAKAPIKAAADVGEAAQSKVPEGAANPKIREERNSGRDQNIFGALNTIKDRVDPDKIVAKETKRQNIFNPKAGLNAAGGLKAQQGVKGDVAFSDSPASLQLNVGFKPADKAPQLSVGNPVAERDLARKPPKVDPLEPAKGELPLQAEEVTEKASEAAEKVKDAAPDVNGGGLNKLKNKITDAAVSNNSPQRQLDQAAGKAKNAANNISTKPVAFAWGTDSLQVNVAAPNDTGLTGRGGGDNAALKQQEADDLSNASFQEPQGNVGGITQPTMRGDLKGNPKRGGDLKDAPTSFAAQNKMERDEGTPGQDGATPRAGANTPKGLNELRNPKTPTLPNSLGGKNFVRDDAETPEKTASGNIAKAQQSSGNAIDSAKQALGL